MAAVAHVELEGHRETCPAEPAIFHGYANLFPLIEGPAYWDLVSDIREHGVHEPVVMYEGKILDGRNRFLAARECGRDYPVTEYVGADPLGYVVSLNLKRRHLSESQRAMVAAKLAKMPVGANQHVEISTPTHAQSAALLNVSRESVVSARRVHDHGSAALVTSVEIGAVSVSAAAEVARLPEAAQVALVEEGPQAVKNFAAEVRATPPEQRDELRRQVIEAAESGLKRERIKAPSRRNPDYDPDPAFQAMAKVAGHCQAIAETVDAVGFETILNGFLDEAMRSRNLQTFRAARDALNVLIGAESV